MGLAEQLTAKMTALLSEEPFDPAHAREVGEWFGTHFRTNTSRTPPGTKDAKKVAESFAWWLRNSSMYKPGVAGEQLAHEWAKVQAVLPTLVRAYTSEGGTEVPVEVKVGQNTYQNRVGLTAPALAKLTARMEAIFASVRGWRRGALKGGVTVVVARPEDFRSTAKGKYRTSEDALYIRATPEILKRGEGSYGSAEYIVVHELGHRFERWNATPGIDGPSWWTTAYSKTDGEAFAELFALSHFGTVPRSGPVDPAVVEKFDKLMSNREEQVARVASRWLARNLRSGGSAV